MPLIAAGHARRRGGFLASRLIAALAVALCMCLGAEAQAVRHLELPGQTTPLGSTLPAQPVIITTTTADTVASVLVVTQGSPNLDFTTPGSGTCVNAALNSGVPCTVDVAFTPRAPGRRSGAVLLIGQGHEVMGSQLIDGVGDGPLAVIRPGTISVVAGVSSQWVYQPSDENGPAGTAHIFLPSGVATDAAGNVYISDTSNNRIRKVDTHGIITTYAGTGAPSKLGDGGPAVGAGLSGPAGLAVDGAGNLYIADAGNNAIRRVDAVTGILTTVAGSLLNNGFGGDGGDARLASLFDPNGVTLDPDGNLYIADTGNNVIRRVDTAGKISTFAGDTSGGSPVAGYGGDEGPASAAKFNQPWSMAIDTAGNLYIADMNNAVVRMIDTSQVVHLIAGQPQHLGAAGSGGPATSALLNGPVAVAVDPLGNVYIADSSNNRIQRVDAHSHVMTTVQAVQDGVLISNGSAQTAPASLYGPYALTIDGQGNLLIADYFHNRVSRINAASALLAYPTIRVSKTSAPQLETIENDGTTALTPTDYVQDQTDLDPATTTCGTQSLQPGSTCNLGVEFSPTAVSPQNGTTNGSLTIKSDASNTPTKVTVAGVVLTVEPTTTTLTSSLNPAGVSQNVTFTAVVSSADVNRTGSVSFYDGSSLLATVNLANNGTAQFSISTLPLGSHTIVAKYSGDASNASSQSPPLTESILQTTHMTVVSSLNPAQVTQSITFTATLTANTPVAAGTTISFFDGTGLIGTGQLTGSGTAQYTTSTLTAGTHNITARFDGNTGSLSSVSPTLVQVVSKTSTSTLLSANPTVITVGSNVALQATVASIGGPLPTGSVTFKFGNITLGATPVDANGVASLTTALLTPGTADAVTATYGGDSSNNGSTSRAVTVEVDRLTTVTTLASSLATGNAGSPVQLTATVSMAAGQQADGAITGNVTFYSDGTSLGSGALSSGGTATLSTSALTVGTHSLTAVYGGNTNYNTSTSDPLSQPVQKSPSSSFVSLNAGTVTASKQLILTATVTTAGVKATGTVTFSSEAGTLGTATLNSSGTTTFTTSTLPVGTHAISVTYNGDANYTSSTSAPSPVTIRIGNTLLTLAASAASITATSPETLTVALTTDGVLPANTQVQLQDNGVSLGTVTINAQGGGALNTSTLAVGSHSIVAIYPGDANNAAAQSVAVPVTVKAATTTTALVSSENPAVVGDTVRFTATVTSGVGNVGGTVTFNDGSALLGSATITNGTASINLSTLPVGSHNITATYAGDSIHSGSTSPAVAESIVQPSSVSLRSSANPSTAGTAVTLTAQVSPNSHLSTQPTGTVSFQDGATLLGTGTLNSSGVATFNTSSLAVGTHNIIAVYGGDSLYQSTSSDALAQVVQIAQTQAAITASPNPANYGAGVVLTAKITGTGGAVRGTVTFLDGTAGIGSATVAADGSASITTSTLSPGLHSISVRYAGDANNASSQSPAVTEQVLQPAQVSLSSSANPLLTLSTLTLTATVRNTAAPVATGTIRFTDGSVLLGSATLNASGVAAITAGPLSAGVHNIVASYSGDAGDLPATSQSLAITVNLRGTQTALTATVPTTAAGGVLSLISALHWDGPNPPTGLVTFSTASGVIGTSNVDAAGVATLNVASSAINGKVTASYAGDASYSGSESAPTDVGTITSTNFTLTLVPGSVSMPTKKYQVAQLAIQSLAGFSDTLQLGCLGLPTAATCTFDKDTVTLTANGSVAVKVTVDTGSPLTVGGQASLHGPASNNGLGTTLCALPLGGMLAWVCFGRKRRRLAVTLTLLLLSGAAMMPLTGCGTINVISTPPGSYTFSISAVGQKTGVTLSQKVTMTVTQ